MNDTASKVVRNSVWLIAQPLLLSIISLFVVGLVARTLGPNNYGIFVFAFAFTTMFKPVINFGLRALTVRTIAEDKSRASEYIGQMLVLRFFLGLLAVGLIYLSLILFDYSEHTVYFTLFASLTILTQSIFTTFHDGFQAFEKMRYIAISQLVGGLFVSGLSVIVMLLEMGLFELMTVYVIGSTITLIMCIHYQWKYFEPPRLVMDLTVYASALKQGFPFFVPMVLNAINGRLGVLILSKFGGNGAVAIYGAATNLTDKLLVIPEGLGASIFPAISVLYDESKLDEAVGLFQRFSCYIVLCGLPLAVGTTALSDEIIHLIYGPDYVDTALLLSILIWGIFFLFVRSVFGWTLSAIHQERLGAAVSLITTPIFVALCFYLAFEYGATGVAVAVVFNNLLGLLLIYYFLRKYFTKDVFPPFFLLRSFLAVSLMYTAIFYTKPLGFFVAFTSAIIIYAVCVIFLRLVTMDEINQLKLMLQKRGR